MDGNQSCGEWAKVRRCRKNVGVLGTAGAIIFLVRAVFAKLHFPVR